MHKARRLFQGKGLQPETVYTAIGLMAITGMRISEVLHLQISDVDLENHVITVRESKFHKSRLLPVHATTTAKLSRYDKRRRRLFPAAQSFFVWRRGEPLTYGAIQPIFHRLVEGIENRGFHTGPRLHDLRHAFACRVLTRWSKHPATVDQRILWLMHYLGHIRISHTYWYLSAIPELVSRAAAHFEKHVGLPHA
jgi:integrase